MRFALTAPLVLTIIAGVTQAALVAVFQAAGRRVSMGPMAMRIHIRRGPVRAR
jgi:hypothetical protein